MRKLLISILVLASCSYVSAQELNAKVSINSAKIANTKKEVFDALKEKTQEFLNTHKWTTQTYQEKERIECSFGITVNEWDEDTHNFKASLLLTASRPVYGSAYNTTVYSVTDSKFDFEFETSSQLEYNPENLDNQLVALLAYYAYVIIGMDMDSFADMGGTDVLQIAEDLVIKAQNLGFAGWSAYDDSKNRYARLYDYMDPSMDSMRHLNYKYHRKGLDQMSEDVEGGRKAMMEAMRHLDEARQGKTMSNVPLLFTEYKRDEILNIFQKQGTAVERNYLYEVLFRIDPSHSTQWEKLKL